MASSFRDFTIWQYFATIIKLVKLLAQCEQLRLTGIIERLFKENFVSDFQAFLQLPAISLFDSFALLLFPKRVIVNISWIGIRITMGFTR